MKEFNKYYLFIFLILLTFMSQKGFAYTPFQITTLDNPAPGYLRFDMTNNQDNKQFFLVDNSGKQIYFDTTHRTSNNYVPLRNGNWALLENNRYKIYNQKLELVDTIPNPTSGKPDSCYIEWHAMCLLSNGHYLILLSRYIPKDMSLIIEGGQKNAQIVSNSIIETDRTGIIYWEWKAYEHFNLLDVSSNIDLKQLIIDMTHINSFIEDTDGNIIVSVRHYDEVAKIDKSTGNFIWRLGGSECKNNQFTFTNDDQNGFIGFSHQHSVCLTDNNNLLMYDNGNLKNPTYSRAVEYQLDITNKIATKVWEYRDVPEMFQMVMGSVQRLPNGNTLINWGKFHITEVRPDKTIVFDLKYSDINKVNVYRAYRVVTRMDAVSKIITNTGNYSYNNDNYSTGVDLNIIDKNGTGYSSIEKHYYLPEAPSFIDSTFTQLLSYRWVFNKTDISNLNAIIKIKANTVIGLTSPDKAIIYARDNEGTGPFAELQTSYNRTTGEITANFSSSKEFLIGTNILSKPILLKPTNNSVNPINGIAGWSLVQGAVKYQIQFDTSAFFNLPLINKFVFADNFYNFDSLKYSTKYFWRVRALNNRDTSDWSEIFEFSTYLSKTKLLSPLNSENSFRINGILKWNLVSGAEMYRVQISTSKTFSVINYDLNNLIKEEVNVPNLKYNTLYYWRVLAYNSSNTSDWSDTWSFLTVLKSPALLKPDDQITDAPLKITFTWNEDFGNPSYRIQITNDPNFTNIFIDSNLIKGNEVQFSGFSLNTKYYWRVIKLTENNESDWSEIREFTTVKPYINLISPNGGEIFKKDSSYQIRWESNIQDLIKIDLLKNNEKISTLMDSLNGLLSSSNWTIPENITDGNLYKLRLTSLSDSEYSDESEDYFTIESGVRVNEETLKTLEISNYPNPSGKQTKFDFTLDDYGRVSISLYDVYGKEISKIYSQYLAPGQYQYTWDASKITAGVYFYKFSFKNILKTNKLIILR